MKNIRMRFQEVVCFFLLLIFPIMGSAQIKKEVKHFPVYSEVVYEGNDKVYNDNPLNPGEFYNPILQGCYPDPSITRKGDDYF